MCCFVVRTLMTITHSTTWTLESSSLSMKVMCSHPLSVSIQPHWRSSLKEILWWTILKTCQKLCAFCMDFIQTHLNYPKSMKNTFQIIQQVLLMLGHSELKPRLQTLKNCLTMLGNARSFHEKTLVFCRTRH